MGLSALINDGTSISPPVSGERPIDLVHLARMTLGDRALEGEVLQLFDRQAGMLVVRMQQGARAGVCAAAHTLRGSAIKNSVPEIEAECGGACACTTCHVYVDEGWKQKTGEPSQMEEDMLDFAFDVKPNSRLSCQIKVSEDLEGLVVRTPERQA